MKKAFINLENIISLDYISYDGVNYSARIICRTGQTVIGQFPVIRNNKVIVDQTDEDIHYQHWFEKHQQTKIA